MKPAGRSSEREQQDEPAIRQQLARRRRKNHPGICFGNIHPQRKWRAVGELTYGIPRFALTIVETWVELFILCPPPLLWHRLPAPDTTSAGTLPLDRSSGCEIPPDHSCWEMTPERNQGMGYEVKFPANHRGR
ncbi:hypothetical protein AAFF_G00130390 [Aldrovandia affinis]|uniref:Uncharacterized protein n=1 Tax=Aldrovandia affinis TaxID=143900 RepID=A0AAD7RTN7_9TELE|nr:hypothetical protein AAFF_G00130390 [Aldrovandia affinis]